MAQKRAIEKYDAVELIEKWISCSIHTNNPKLNKIVKEVNVHKHTKVWIIKNRTGSKTGSMKKIHNFHPIIVILGQND